VTVLAAFGLLWWRRKLLEVQAYLVAAIMLYATLYGVTTLTPHSAPGRYLVAAVPAMVMLGAISTLRDGAMYRTRFAVFGGFALVSGVILFGSIVGYVPSAYVSAFPRLY